MIKDVGEKTQEVWDERARRISRRFGYEGLSISRGPESASLLKELGEHGKILDDGCGPGYFLEVLAEYGHDCIGTDISPEMLHLAEAKIKQAKDKSIDAGKRFGDVRLICSSATDLYQIEDNEVDVVVMINLLQDVPFPEKCLEEARRVTKHGGDIFLTVPPRESIGIVFRYAPHKFVQETGKVYNADEGVESFQQTYSRTELEQMSRRTGLKMVYLSVVTADLGQIKSRWNEFIPNEHMEVIGQIYKNGVPVLYKTRMRVMK